MSRVRIYQGAHPSEVPLSCQDCGKVKYYSKTWIERHLKTVYRCGHCAALLRNRRNPHTFNKRADK